VSRLIVVIYKGKKRKIKIQQLSALKVENLKISRERGFDEKARRD
jgi:hypothetical protein